MPVQVKTSVKIKLPKLDFTKVLQEVAEKIVIPDMRLGINRSVGIDQKPFQPLEASTLARKSGVRKSAKSKGGLGKVGLAGGRGGTQTLVDTGALRESFASHRIKTNHVRINIGPEREQVGYFLQVAGVGRKKKKFNFFGISQRAEFQAISKMKKALTDALKAVNGR